uniref:Uncharacterized protein n=1 Tax=Molossus molossus TaxID=27622 RepID=A0A7J8JXN5_MOLMO|nr:hypothetical protein HJG59_008076 [Molossus molossus]
MEGTPPGCKPLEDKDRLPHPRGHPVPGTKEEPSEYLWDEGMGEGMNDDLDNCSRGKLSEVPQRKGFLTTSSWSLLSHLGIYIRARDALSLQNTQRMGRVMWKDLSFCSQSLQRGQGAARGTTDAQACLRLRWAVCLQKGPLWFEYLPALLPP